MILISDGSRYLETTFQRLWFLPPTPNPNFMSPRINRRNSLTSLQGNLQLKSKPTIATVTWTSLHYWSSWRFILVKYPACLPIGCFFGFGCSLWPKWTAVCCIQTTLLRDDWCRLLSYRAITKCLVPQGHGRGKDRCCLNWEITQKKKKMHKYMHIHILHFPIQQLLSLPQNISQALPLPLLDHRHCCKVFLTSGLNAGGLSQWICHLSVFPFRFIFPTDTRPTGIKCKAAMFLPVWNPLVTTTWPLSTFSVSALPVHLP